MRRERGQILPIVAILSAVLAGFVGLVIDVGGVASGQQDAQAAADGAALGAASDIGQGTTIATATSYAQAVLTSAGMPTSRLTLSFLDSTGATTTDTTLVASVTASVAYQRATQFLSVLGVGSTGVASAAAGVMPAPNCGVCLYGNGSSLNLANGSTLTVRNAGVAVNSIARNNISVGTGATLTAQFVAVAVNRIRNSGTITPAPIVRTAAGDPYGGLAAPVVVGVPAAVDSSVSGSATLTPGVYSTINAGGSTTLTLSPGVYVVTGGITIDAPATLTGTGVTIYLACGAYPTPCAPGDIGAGLNILGGTTNLVGPNSGTYAGVTVFADRNNGGTTTISGGAVTMRGAFYATAMILSLAPATGSVTLASQLLLASMSVTGSATVDLVPRLL